MLGFAKTLLLAAQLAVIANATPTVNNNNELTTHWPNCVRPTKVQDEKTPTEKRGSVETPLPTQPGMVDNCKKFCFVQPGNKCYEIARDNNISVEDFLKWNPGADPEGHHLWANTYACIGVE